jgi:tripeptide aminopeptidase
MQMNTAELKKAEKLLFELLAIPGVSGEEGPVLEFIAKQLRKAGAPAKAIVFDRPPGKKGTGPICATTNAARRCPPSGRSGKLDLSPFYPAGNLVLQLPGTFPAARRMLMAHVDTVPICRSARPVRRGNMVVPADKTTGLGADDRAGTAVVLNTALTILREKLPHPPLTFLWTVQEEVGLCGSRHAKLSLLGRPRLAFNFDGGPPEKLTYGATGGYRMDIRVHGLASHAGVCPEQGVSAVTIAALAIARLHRDGWLGKIDKADHLGTSNIGVVHGGEATNVVAPLVELRAEARSHEPEFRARIIAAIEKAFREAAGSVRNVEGACGRVEIVGHLDYESFRLAENEPCLLAAEQAVRDCGGSPLPAISNGGLDANWMSARGIPTVTLGCGQQNVHTTAERLDLVEFRRACQIALRLATGS